MTKEKKNLLTAAVIITIVYAGTLWQRPMFSPAEYDFAAASINPATDFAALLNGLFGKALGFNIVSVRLLSAVSSIICALIVRYIATRESNENTGNIAGVIYLSTILTYAWGSSCSRTAILTLFFTCFAASLYLFFEHATNRRTAFLSAVAAGCSAGFFSISATGYTAFYLPLAVASGYALQGKRFSRLPLLGAGVFFAAAVIFIWQKKSGLPAMPQTVKFHWYDLLCVAGLLPWVLFVPQVITGWGKNFFKSNICVMTLFIFAAAMLTFPVWGLPVSLALVLPFSAVICAIGLSRTAGNERAFSISEKTLKIFSLLLLLAAIIIVTVNLGSSWQFLQKLSFRKFIHLPKAELAGFSVAIAVALIHYKIACDEKISTPGKKLIYVATGTAVLMILLPGAIFSSIKLACVPDEFFARTLKMYTTADSALYADSECINTVKWVIKDRKVTLITKEKLPELARKVQNGNAAVISTNYGFTKLLPKSKMLFARGKWRIAVFNNSGHPVTADPFSKF